MRRTLVVTVGLIVLLLAASTARADELHSTTFSGALVEVDTSDASAYVIGSNATIARGVAFDVDGTLYATVRSGRYLGTFDLATGALTQLGPVLSSGGMDAIEIDASGQLYGVTGDGMMYQIDKTTGTPTYLWSLGVRNIQDLAYDPAGTLWGVSQNSLYWIDVATGDAELVGPIGGALEGNVFGITFDQDGRLWATSTVLDAPLYEIDLDTLDVGLVGYIGVDYPRGCDIFVAPAPPALELPTDTDEDGVPDEDDAFPESDMRDTVWVGERDTGVENVLFEDGSTIADLVAACAEDVDKAGKYVRSVAHLVCSLRKDGAISRSEQGAILRAAAKLFRKSKCTPWKHGRHKSKHAHHKHKRHKKHCR